MPIARNDQGDYVVLGDDGQWTPAKTAVNPETGAKLIHDGTSWIPQPPPERTTGERVVRGVQQPAAGFNESLATTLGALPDMAGAGMRAVGLPSSDPGFYTDLARRGIRGVTTLGGLLPDAPKPETGLERALYAGGKGVGDAASVLLPATAVSQTAQAGGMVSELAKALAAQPGAQLAAGGVGGVVGEATDSPLAGLAAAMVTPSIMSAATRLVKPIRPNLPPETQRLIDVAQQEGIPLTAAQQTGSKPLKYLEGAFDNLPFTAGPQEEIRQGQRAAFNKASLSKSGTVGDIATSEVLNAARERIGGKIGEIADRNVLLMTPEVRGELNGLGAEMQRLYPDQVAKPVIARIDEVLSKDVAGAIPGELYRRMDSALGKQITNTTDGIQKEALGRLRETLRSAMDESISPSDQAAWQQARRQYANLMVTAKAAGGAGEAAATGNVSPLALKGAVDQSTGRGYAFGRGDQNDLARVGQAFLRPAPDSGTASRSYWQNLLTGGGAAGALGGTATMAGASPLAAAMTAAATLAGPRVVQAGYNSPAVQQYLTQGIPGLAGVANQAPQINRELAAALLGQRVKDILPGQRQ